MINEQLYITSTNKAAMIAERTGNLNLQIISLLQLYSYMEYFTEQVINSSTDESVKDKYIEINKLLKEKINHLKYKFSDIICNYKVVISNKGVIDFDSFAAPTVDGLTISIPATTTGAPTYSLPVTDENPIVRPLTKEMFTTNYQSAFTPDTVIIYPDLPSELKIEKEENGIRIPVIEKEEFDIDNLNLFLLRFTPDSLANQTLPFRVSDKRAKKKYSTIAEITIETPLIEENQPATIGDNTIYIGNRAVTILTLEMLTSQLQPPYNDPENDDIDAIRIDEISNANKGLLYLDNTLVEEGQIITKEQIESNLFSHQAPNADDINSDSFNFSARDSGSMIWVT